MGFGEELVMLLEKLRSHTICVCRGYFCKFAKNEWYLWNFP